MSDEQLIAKHLNNLFTYQGKLMLDFNCHGKPPQRYPVSKSVSHRIKAGNLTGDAAHDFILMIKDGVIEDFDTRPKITNSPLQIDETPGGEGVRKDKVIFKKNKLGEVSIFKNLGISETATVDSMRNAVEERLESEEGLKVDDVLNDLFFVSDIRNDGSLIHVEPLHS